MCPIYEYKCPCCGEILEIQQKFGDPAPMCPNCPKKDTTNEGMVKILSKSSFILKGSGWARDLYSKKK